MYYFSIVTPPHCYILIVFYLTLSHERHNYNLNVCKEMPEA